MRKLPRSNRSRSAVIGIGNELMGDDGIGPRLIAELKLRKVRGVDLIDLATGGIQLVHELSRYDRVVIVDAADMGLTPGEFKVFSPEQATSVRFTKGYSLHDWDVMRSISISKELGEAPVSIAIFAIQPGSIREGEYISEGLAEKRGLYLDELERLIIHDQV